MGVLAEYFGDMRGLGGKLLENLGNKAILGNDQAAKIALAKEQNDWAGINGSGPTDREGALEDAKADYRFRNPFSKDGATARNPAFLLVLGVVIVLAVILIKRLAK